jgi:hypothetical protein
MLALQAGVITRAQARTAGMSRHAIDWRLHSDRWQRVHRGVYVAFSGKPDRERLRWAAVLGAGPAAALSHQSAAELYGMIPAPEDGPIHVTVPSGLPVCGLRGVVIHYSKRLEAARHPALLPPRTRVEETILDLAVAAATEIDAIAWILTGCASRRTTPARVAAAMRDRARLRRRKLLTGAVEDARIGVHSTLEHGYLHRVEGPHGLPRGTRQRRTRRNGVSRYEDVRYEAYGIVVELDGRAAHPEEERWKDAHRDNASAARGLVTLRYSYADVMHRPCEVAAEVARALRGRGDFGDLRACGAGCPAPGTADAPGDIG